MSDSIVYARSGPVAYITLNHPARHNALGRAQLDALNSCLADIEVSTEVRVVVVTGAGDKTFCAGASLTELSAGEITDDAFQAVTARIASLAVPTICALNGNVFGGGVELAVACDFRLGIEGMRMRVPAATLGLCYPLEGIRRFVECLGVAVTRRILVASEEFDTGALLQIGFLDQVVAREKLADAAEAFALRIAGHAPLAVQSMNQILRQMALAQLDESAAQALVSRCLKSQDLQEGFAAQREKREPRFEGR